MRVPAPYTLVGVTPVRAAIRRDLVPALADWLLAPRLVPPPDAAPLDSGRGGAYRAVVGDDLRVVVRPCRRGGLMAHLLHETYVGLRPRPLRELAVTTEARRRGVSAAEVLAVRVEGWLAYRGALVTAEVRDALTLFDALRAAPDAPARAALAAAAGEAVRTLHGAGVFHADLNLRNLLVQQDAGGPRVVLLDFDRAWLRAGPLGRTARRRNLSRLARSAAKLDPERLVVTAAERAAFLAAYAAGGPSPCAS